MVNKIVIIGILYKYGKFIRIEHIMIHTYNVKKIKNNQYDLTRIMVHGDEHVVIVDLLYCARKIKEEEEEEKKWQIFCKEIVPDTNNYIIPQWKKKGERERVLLQWP